MIERRRSPAEVQVELVLADFDGDVDIAIGHAIAFESIGGLAIGGSVLVPADKLLDVLTAVQKALA